MMAYRIFPHLTFLLQSNWKLGTPSSLIQNSEFRIRNCEIVWKRKVGNWQSYRPGCHYWFTNTNPGSKSVFGTFGVYVSQLVRYARACFKYQDFGEREKLLTRKLLTQVYHKVKLVPTVAKLCERHHDLVDPYNVVVFKLISDLMAWAEAYS